MIIGALGIITTLPMKQMALRKNLDDNWGFQTSPPNPESNSITESGSITFVMEGGGGEETEEKRAA